MKNLDISDDKSIFSEILNRFQNFSQVETIAVGGSISAKTCDNKSDIDIYIFVNENIPVKEREELIKKYSSKYEAGGEYFGSGDEFFVEGFAQLDVMYWNTTWFKECVQNVWVNHFPSNGYTTAFLYTLNNFNILYDKNNWLQEILNSIKTPYPNELKQNIITRNMMLMKDKPFASYFEQIKKALDRNDVVSVNHRISAFLASYFDVLFAKNELLHSGEKRLVTYALNNCKSLPKDFEKNINNLLIQPNPNTLNILNDMVENLRKI